MKALFQYLDKIPKKIIPVLSVALVILLGGIDRSTGYEISFSIFYLMPVLFISWFGERSHAVIISILSAVTWLWADLGAGHSYSHPAIPVWNTIMRLGFFLMGVFSISTVKQLLEKQEALAKIDFLTGVINSRAFNETAELEIEKSLRFGHAFTIAYIDIDNFKKVNDTLGHSQGDHLLQSVAKTMQEKTRSIDTVARLGGDEFAIMLPETNEEGAKTAIGKLQRHLFDVAKSNKWQVTFSIGVVTCYESCKLDELIKEADNLMYSVKESGKNAIRYKVHGAQSPVI